MTRDEIMLEALNVLYMDFCSNLLYTDGMLYEDVELLKVMITEHEVASMANDYIDAEYEEVVGGVEIGEEPD